MLHHLPHGSLRLLRRLTSGSVNRQILGALLTVGLLTLGVKLATVAKDVILAAFFGTSDATDAFFTAFLLPNFIISVVAGSFNAAMIPVYVETYEKRGMEAAQRLFSAVVLASIILLTAVTLLLALMSHLLLPLFGTGFSDDKLILTQGIFYILLPVIPLSGIVTIWSAALNANERFALASFSSIVVPLAAVLGLLLLPQSWGVRSVAVGTVVGFVIQLGILTVGLRHSKLSLIPQWHGWDPALTRVLKQYLPMVGGQFIMSSTLLVDQAMAASLGSGSVSTLNYGNRLVALPLSIGTFALGTAVLPYFSRMVTTGNWDALRHSIRTYSMFILAVTIPVTIIGVVFSTPIAEILFQRGQFTATDTVVVSQVQALYLLQVPFLTVGILFVRVISSLQANYVLAWGSIISFIVNVILDYFLMQIWGVAGIALATSGVYVVACIFLGLMLQVKLREVAL
jgi:putative peptidoglycan lipid II flippase